MGCVPKRHAALTHCSSRRVGISMHFICASVHRCIFVVVHRVFHSSSSSTYAMPLTSTISSSSSSSWSRRTCRRIYILARCNGYSLFWRNYHYGYCEVEESHRLIRLVDDGVQMIDCSVCFLGVVGRVIRGLTQVGTVVQVFSDCGS